ncbi:MAG TPA: FAD-dependent oxidoreductase [Actinomycetota bacterium]|nr:FAD-dependent oxidoreductase [Actinomycetota bacterium]
MDHDLAPGARRSWWLREALRADPGEPCPPLAGSTEADVVVVGGGYTGMWTSYFLARRAPGIRVVLLEADILGGGPSGRNGGFVTGWWDELPRLVDLFGEEAALRACRAVAESVDAIGRWCLDHGVDAWYRKAGYLGVACSPAQEAGLAEAVELAARLGVGEELVALSAEEVRARCRSPVFRGGVLMRAAATVQPARLARGLRRALLELGVRVHEGSPVVRFAAGGGGCTAETPGGRVRAGQAVLALNAWAQGFPRLRRYLVTRGSYLVLTEPAPGLLEELGWTGGECITDLRTSLHYFRTTPDGRIAFGGGGARTDAFGRVDRRFTHDRKAVRRTVEGFRRFFPAFASVRLVEAWGGPVDVSPTHLPFFGTFPGGRVHFGAGYSGNGVAPSHLGGQVLASLVLGAEDELTRLPLVNRLPPPLPPEPLRSLGAALVNAAAIRKDRAEERGRRPGVLTRLAVGLPARLGYHLPTGRPRRPRLGPDPRVRM